MRSNAILPLALGLLGIMAGSLAHAGATRTADQAPVRDAVREQCLVKINRDAGAGVFEVTRQVIDQRCVCIVRTGPVGQGNSTEASITEILHSGSCASAPPDVVRTAQAGGSALGAILPMIGGFAVAGGATAAAFGSSAPDENPITPVVRTDSPGR